MVSRLGVLPRSPEEDTALAGAAFRALAAGREALRWEPFFFDWFCGPASEARALGGPRAALYTAEEFRALRHLIAAYQPDRPERLAAAYFTGAEPEELLYDEIETIWSAIDAHDDWSPFNAKLARLDQARVAMALRT
jgi:hypothetical protein